jgi:hypothetical protein
LCCGKGGAGDSRLPGQPGRGGERLGAGQPAESTQKRPLGAYIKVGVLAASSGIAYFAFAARWPGEPVTIRIVLAAGLIAINAISDFVALRQRQLREAWSAAHAVDALDTKPGHKPRTLPVSRGHLRAVTQGVS